MTLLLARTVAWAYQLDGLLLPPHLLVPIRCHSPLNGSTVCRCGRHWHRGGWTSWSSGWIARTL